MSEYKISVPRPKLPKKFAKSPAKYLRKKVIDVVENMGILTTENREEYLQRIDHEIFHLLLSRSFKSKKTCFIRTRDDYPAENAIESS
ncbi:MAG: hypothetical protein J6R12_00120 [Bacteroidales bacterium]|nr:hypothetical protein [Bacteroidales bacterium]